MNIHRPGDSLAVPPLVLAVLSSACAFAQGKAEPRPKVPQWIWHGAATEDQTVVLRREFTVDRAARKAVLTASCDNRMKVILNGEELLTHGAWWEVARRDVALREGRNTLQVEAYNEGGPAALALRLAIRGAAAIVTDGSWQGATPEQARAGRWSAVQVIGAVGDPDQPWTAQVTAEHFGLRGAPQRPSAPQRARPAADLHLPDGFRAELLYTVPKPSQGSWVALTRGPAGQLFASDQGGAGIYRITPAVLGDAESATRVEKVPVPVSGAQGLCWAHDSLYANCSGKGLYRITDSDGDGSLDRAEHIIPLNGGGEHGPHAVIATEDGKGIYFAGGNHTDPPKFEGSRAPSNWKEDLLLPRQWDASGHARGKLAPGGWIARCDPDGSHIEIRSSGYRNQYDIALDPEGEMFTYDADMEWDLGTPWYRPTRVCQAVSGSEFGWRSGTGKWPAYYEDSLPPVLDIGPGSPTGVVFGTGARFPARYQRALYILDWTFGTIYAIHLQPSGAGYTASKEHFLWNKPLPVTDAVVGADGALYFTVGGRSSQSALYRVVYGGPDSTAPVQPAAGDPGAEARRLRRSLEAFHGKADPAAVATAWPHLGSADRFVRFAARIAVESQPVDSWRERALAEGSPLAAAVALVALARQGAPADLSGVLTALSRIELAGLGAQELLVVLRAHALAFTRLGAPDDRMRGAVAARLDALFPAASDPVNTELVRLLTFLQSPSVVPKTLALMRRAGPPKLPDWAELIKRNGSYGGPIAKMLEDPPPLQRLGYAFMLRNAKSGWTLPLRQEYFAFFADAARHSGGHSYAGFLRNIRDEAESQLSVSDRHRLAGVLEKPLVTPPPADIVPAAGPGRRWTVAEAVRIVGTKRTGRNFDRGRNLFHAAACSTCHRIGGTGGAIGPDLTTVANKFSVAEILESILQPSKVISDQYGSQLVTARDGRVAAGLVVETDGGVKVYPADPKAAPAVFARADIASVETSKLSQMPPGLVDALNPEELADLVAYLLSGGDKRAAVYRKPRR